MLSVFFVLRPAFKTSEDTLSSTKMFEADALSPFIVFLSPTLPGRPHICYNFWDVWSNGRVKISILVDRNTSNTSSSIKWDDYKELNFDIQNSAHKDTKVEQPFFAKHYIDKQSSHSL